MKTRSLAAVLALAGLLGACASWPGRPPPAPAGGQTFDAAWDDEVDEAAQWTGWLSQAIDRDGAELLEATPQDAAVFCPRYAELRPRDRKQFWILLISGIAERESSFEARAYLQEPPPLNERSIGLMQLSLSDAEDFGCHFATESEIASPADNLDCAVRIMNTLVEEEDLIGGDPQHTGQGLAGYWAVLNEAPHREAREVILGHTRSMPACGSAG